MQDEKRKNKLEWQDQIATPDRLARLFDEQAIPDSAWQPAQIVAGLIPTKDDWLRFIDILLVSTGTIFLLAGILFFFAFNWDDLSRMYRFGITQGAVIIAVIAAFAFNMDKFAGRLALASSAILLGIALAVVGQEYQTGADSYRLFLIWLLMITGWVLISRWNIMYLLWMILLNVTIGFYWQQVIFDNWVIFNLTLLILNASFVFLWEIIRLRTQWAFMMSRWFLYLVMFIALGHATILMSDFIFDGSLVGSLSVLQPLAYLSLIGLTVFFYMNVEKDILMIALSALSVLVIAVAIMVRFVTEANIDPIFSFFLIGIGTIALTAGLATVLRQLNQRWEQSS